MKLMKFYADWCQPCKLMDSVIESVKPEFPNVEFVNINVEQEPLVARRYNVRSLPTFILLDGDEVAAQRIGTMTKAEMVKMLAKGSQ